MCGYSVPNYPEQAIQEKLYVISLACPRQKDARRGHPASAGKPISVFKVSSSDSMLAGSTGRYRDGGAKLWVPCFQRSEPDVS